MLNSFADPAAVAQACDDRDVDALQRADFQHWKKSARRRCWPTARRSCAASEAGSRRSTSSADLSVAASLSRQRSAADSLAGPE